MQIQYPAHWFRNSQGLREESVGEHILIFFLCVMSCSLEVELVFKKNKKVKSHWACCGGWGEREVRRHISIWCSDYLQNSFPAFTIHFVSLFKDMQTCSSAVLDWAQGLAYAKLISPLSSMPPSLEWMFVPLFVFYTRDSKVEASHLGWCPVQRQGLRQIPLTKLFTYNT